MRPVKIAAEIDRITVGIHIFQFVKKVKTVSILGFQARRLFCRGLPCRHIVARRGFFHFLNQSFLLFLNFLHPRRIGKLRPFGMGYFVIHSRCGRINTGNKRP